MKVIGIDAGTTHSAGVVYNCDTQRPEDRVTQDNDEMLKSLASLSSCENVDAMFIEVFESFGMPVGRSVFETCEWVGQFILQWKLSGKRFYRVTRREVKLTLCQNMRAKDANVTQAIKDLYGNSKEVAVGTNYRKGPLYWIKIHEWSALAVAIVGLDKANMQNKLEMEAIRSLDNEEELVNNSVCFGSGSLGNFRLPS